MQYSIRLATVATTALLALAGCGQGAGQQGGGEVITGAQEPDFSGRWVADDPADAFLQFEVVDEDGGTVSGGDGCNGVGGEFHIDGDTAQIERGAGTLKGCPGVDTWLSDVSSVVVDGDTMTVQNGDGEEIGMLERDEDEESMADPTASIDEAEDNATPEPSEGDGDSQADSNS